MIRVLAWLDRRAGWIVLLALAMAAALVLTSCGSTTDRQTRTVEKETTVTAPIVIDSPIGQFVIQPAKVEHAREQTEVEQTKRTIDLPDPAPILAAAVGGTPWGALVGGVVSAGLAAFAGKKAIDYKRRFAEVVDGVERGMADIPDEHRETMIAALEKEQSNDTKSAVKDRVG